MGRKAVERLTLSVNNEESTLWGGVGLGQVRAPHATRSGGESYRNRSHTRSKLCLFLAYLKHLFVRCLLASRYGACSVARSEWFDL